MRCYVAGCRVFSAGQKAKSELFLYLLAVSICRARLSFISLNRALNVDDSSSSGFSTCMVLRQRLSTSLVKSIDSYIP